MVSMLFTPRQLPPSYYRRAFFGVFHTQKWLIAGLNSTGWSNVRYELRMFVIKHNWITVCGALTLLESRPKEGEEELDSGGDGGRGKNTQLIFLLIFLAFFILRFVIMDMNEDKFQRHISQCSPASLPFTLKFLFPS